MRVFISLRSGLLQSSLLLILLAFLAVGSCAADAQTAGSRIAGPIDDRIRVALAGNVHPLAQAQYDQGAVTDSFPAQRMFLLLQRSPQREASLRQFLQDVHRQGSPRYHKWLTPEQFGALYGPDDSEIAAVSAWLQKHGFSLARFTKGKTAMEFSGNAGQVRQAFNTEIHTYLVNGELHHAINRDPQIPAAFASVVAGIATLNDFRPKSSMVVRGKALYDPKTHRVIPQWTVFGEYPPELALGPGDFAVQYDLNPLYNAGINGTGVTIGIIGASDIDPTAVVNYHTMFGLPPLNFNSVFDGNDTSTVVGNWATGESFLDVEVASSIAYGATINLYSAADTTVQSGLLLAAQRAVDDDQAPILSTSYLECEQNLGSSGNQFWASLWEQAAAQGQTSLVAAGDNGSAGCDDFDAAQPAQGGLAVNGFASTPWNVAVGGTDFYYSTYNQSSSAQQTQLATYWNLAATEDPTVSLLQPIPEQPWNRAFGLNLYDGGIYDPNTNGITIVAGSGGASTLYSRPAWQSGTGVPADTKRNLPDVSLFAADDENYTFWVTCAGQVGCSPNTIGGGYIEVYAVGGTSASSPAMAAIMALINQKYGPQGQANFMFYPLAGQHPSVFHDVAIGSNDVPCQAGTADCTQSTKNDNTNGFDTLGHYYATAGYDQATGLGSVDANLLVQYWNSLSFTLTMTTLNLSQTTFTHGTPVSVSVAVSGVGGTPSGDVGLVTAATPASNTGVGELTLENGAASTSVDNLPGGQYQLTAKYTGDTIFAPSNSSPVTLSVAAENSTVSIYGSAWSNSSNAFAPITSGSTFPFGTYLVFDAQPRGLNAPQGQLDGLATGAVTFTDSVGGTTLNSGPVNLNRLGIAEWQPAVSFPPGTNNLSVNYPGDPSFSASSSTTPLTIAISKALTIAQLTASPSTIAVGSPTTLSLFVAVPPSGPPCNNGACTFAFPSIPPPTGTATFTLGSTTLGTVPLVPNVGASGYAWATFNSATLPIGSDTITASYSGDGNYNSATSTFNVIVGQAPSLTASANPSSINLAEFTAVTANVSGVSGMPAPTGTITYFAAGAGSDWTDTETLANGSATSVPLAGGIFPGENSATVNVSYSGDSVYGPASVNVTLTVTQSDLSPFALTGTSLTFPAGATTGNVSTITLTPANGFTGTVYFSCALTSSPAGAIHPPTCSITPSVNITSETAVTGTMTVSSTAPTTTSATAARNGRRWIEASGGMLFACFLLIGTLPRQRRGLRVAAGLCILFAVGFVVSCGGGNSGNGGGQTIPGTTPGTYTFTVGGALSSNGVSQAQATVSVTIQ